MHHAQFRNLINCRYRSDQWSLIMLWNSATRGSENFYQQTKETVPELLLTGELEKKFGGKKGNGAAEILVFHRHQAVQGPLHPAQSERGPWGTIPQSKTVRHQCVHNVSDLLDWLGSRSCWLCNDDSHIQQKCRPSLRHMAWTTLSSLPIANACAQGQYNTQHVQNLSL